MAPKRLPLPKRFSAALTEPAYDRLRRLNAEYGLGNNYLLTVLLERLDDFADPERLDAAYRAFIEEYGAPKAGASEPGATMTRRTNTKTTPGAKKAARDTEDPA